MGKNHIFPLFVLARAAAARARPLDSAMPRRATRSPLLSGAAGLLLLLTFLAAAATAIDEPLAPASTAGGADSARALEEEKRAIGDALPREAADSPSADAPAAAPPPASAPGADGATAPAPEPSDAVAAQEPPAANPAANPLPSPPQAAPEQPQPPPPSSSSSSLTPTSRPNRRLAPRDKGTASTGGQQLERESGRGDAVDDYYGLNQNPADHLDRAAFQPSHILAFELSGGEMAEFFEDVSEAQVGTVVRGDWFVTSGDELNLQVVVHDPSGDRLYAEGPTTEVTDEAGYTYSRPASEGSFRFATARAGTHRVTLFNPSASSPRTVTFAWLVGKDDDDPFAARFARGAGRGGKGEGEGDGRGEEEEEDGDGGEAGGPSSPRGGNLTSVVLGMMRRVSRIHKKIDDLTAVQQFADVRFGRHHQTVESTNRRVAWWTAGETVTIILAAYLHYVLVKRIDYSLKPAELPSMV
jgi:hypothetical protein